MFIDLTHQIKPTKKNLASINKIYIHFQRSTKLISNPILIPSNQNRGSYMEYNNPLESIIIQHSLRKKWVNDSFDYPTTSEEKDERTLKDTAISYY